MYKIYDFGQAKLTFSFSDICFTKNNKVGAGIYFLYFQFVNYYQMETSCRLIICCMKYKYESVM